MLVGADVALGAGAVVGTDVGAAVATRGDGVALGVVVSGAPTGAEGAALGADGETVGADGEALGPAVGRFGN